MKNTTAIYKYIVGIFLHGETTTPYYFEKKIEVHMD